MMILTILISKIKAFILFFINTFRRALCCFRKRRRYSNDQEDLSHIVVNEAKNDNDMEMWNDWEFSNRKPSSVQEHIEYYRQQQAKLVRQAEEVSDSEEQSTVDIFQDMTPKITKQQKILINNDVQVNRSYSLEVQHDDTFVSNELENWEDNTGWDKGWDAQELLREKKREERERRVIEQQQKRMEKTNKPNILGSKIQT